MYQARFCFATSACYAKSLSDVQVTLYKRASKILHAHHVTPTASRLQIGQNFEAKARVPVGRQLIAPAIQATQRAPARLSVRDPLHCTLHCTLHRTPVVSTRCIMTISAPAVSYHADFPAGHPNRARNSQHGLRNRGNVPARLPGRASRVVPRLVSSCPVQDQGCGIKHELHAGRPSVSGRSS